MKAFFFGLVCLLFFCLHPLAAQNPPAKEENSLRLVSYNVHNCVGTDNKRNLDRVADIIKKCAPDAAALQELDSMTIRYRRDVLGELARRTGMYATYAPALRIMRGRYGIGLLSKEKPLTVKRIPLPGKEEKRMLLVAEFERYVLLCTHFSLTEADRVASARIILDEAAGVTKPVFLAGDMNDVHGSEMQKTLAERFIPLNDPNVTTFGAGDKAECIDFIYGTGDPGDIPARGNPAGGARYSLLGRGVIDDRVASDHRPVWVDVRLTEQ